MVLEEKPLSDLSFICDYNLISFAPVKKTIEKETPDLLIIVDANNYGRVSRNEGGSIRSLIKQRRIDTAIVDHHELAGHEDVTVMINNKRPATAEEVYVLCFEQLGLKPPPDYAETALLGIISDTQRHKFDHPGYRETYRIVANLMDAGASIEKLENKMEYTNKNQLETIAELARNIINSGKGYSYSFISDEFLKNWQNNEKPVIDLKNAVEFFVNNFIRSFEDNSWGFVIYPDLIAGPNCWGISLRSVSGVKDVSAIAVRLGGGGHVAAAGAKLTAAEVKEVISKVQQAIEAA